MSTCANCDTKIGNPLIGKEIKKLDKSSLDKLNDFLPESVRRPSFCQKCLAINLSSTVANVDSYNIIRRLQDYFHRLNMVLKKLEKQITTNKSIPKEIIELDEFDENFYLISRL